MSCRPLFPGCSAWKPQHGLGRACVLVSCRRRRRGRASAPRQRRWASTRLLCAWSASRWAPREEGGWSDRWRRGARRPLSPAWSGGAAASADTPAAWPASLEAKCKIRNPRRLLTCGPGPADLWLLAVTRAGPWLPSRRAALGALAPSEGTCQYVERDSCQPCLCLARCWWRLGEQRLLPTGVMARGRRQSSCGAQRGPAEQSSQDA